MSRLRLFPVGIALLAVAALTRFIGLGSRFFHQDEAVHAWMANEIVRGAGYHYDPVYHGPLLYHLEALVFNAAGPGNFQARVVPAAFGVLLVGLLLYLLRPYVGQATALTVAALAIISPSLTYYSRFNIHDALIAALTVVIVTAPFDYRRAGLVWFSGATALAVATKLNAYFILSALLLYAAGRVTYGRLRDRPLSIFAFCRRRPGYLALAAGCGSVIFVLLAISTAVYHTRAGDGSVLVAIGTTMDSMLLGGFRYWWTAHQAARLGGPFHYYLPILLIYEPLIFFGVPVALVFYMQRRRPFAAVLLAVLAVEWLLGGNWPFLFASAWLLSILWAVVSLWNTKREFLACWVFVGGLQFLLYSVANEKVPWLVVHIALPWFVVVAVCLADVYRAAGRLPARAALVTLIVVVELFTARTSWIVNTRNRSNVTEPLVQLDYGESVAAVVRQTEEIARSSVRPFRAAIERSVQWPFPWYLRDLQVGYPPGPVGSDSDADVIITADGDLPPVLAGQFMGTRLRYSRWTAWIENVNRGDLSGLLRFMLRHDAWGREDGKSFTVWTRR